MSQSSQLSDWDQLRISAEQRFAREPRPFLKWAGSKQALLKHVIKVLPLEFKNYYEPFLGGGALFFLLEPQKAFLSDACKPLIATFEAVRDNPNAVLKYLDGRKPREKEYYAIRNTPAAGRLQKAANFIYLNKSCWNGLYRVNSDGEFNVPFGWPRTDHIVDPSNLRACSKALKNAQLSVVDFEASAERAKKGDLVYFDPPYVTGHNNNGFRDWNEQLFSWADQERLAKLAGKLTKRGVHVVVSNAAHKEVEKLYSGFSVQRFTRSSTLASAATKRGAVGEVIFYAKT